MNYKCKVHNDHCGSDLFPIILKNPQPIHNDRILNWNVYKANWEELKTLFNQTLIQDPKNTDLTKHFTEILMSITMETIPKTSFSNRHNTPWLYDDCKTAVHL